MRLMITTLIVLLMSSLIWISLRTRTPRPDSLVLEHQAYSLLEQGPLVFELPAGDISAEISSFEISAGRERVVRNSPYLWLKLKLGEANLGLKDLNQKAELCYATQPLPQDTKPEAPVNPSKKKPKASTQFTWVCDSEKVKSLALAAPLVLIEAVDDHPKFSETFKKLFKDHGTRLSILFLSLSRTQLAELKPLFPKWLFSNSGADLGRIQLLQALKLLDIMTWDFDFYFALMNERKLSRYWLSPGLVSSLQRRNRFILVGPADRALLDEGLGIDGILVDPNLNI